MGRLCALVGSVAGLVSTVGAMLWHPTDPGNKMWDTWLFVQPDHPTTPFYLNYLSNCDISCGGPTGGAWDGVGAALSMDGVHFADEGQVIAKDPRAVWLGSGSVLKTVNGTYVMNFSEEYDCEGKDGKDGDGCQSIFFATSDDLVSGWKRIPFAPPPADDPNVFKYGPGYEIGGRWDCIATVPKPGAPGYFYGFWTASPAGHGGAGVGETTDLSGHHWKSLPPITNGMPNAEVGSTVVIDGKYYMLYHGGHLYVSSSPTTGYVPDPVNPDFHTDGDGVAFSRLWNVQGQEENQTVLLTHQWLTNGMIYLGPIKEAKVGRDGTLRAMYWYGNERLKGREKVLTASDTKTKVFVQSCQTSFSSQKWLMTNGTLRFVANDTFCLGFVADAAELVPCSSTSAASAMVLAKNGSLMTKGFCIGATGTTIMLMPCTKCPYKWTISGGYVHLQTTQSLQPIALWQFNNSSNVGVNSGSVDGNLDCVGAACTQFIDGTDSPRSHSLMLSANSYLSYKNCSGVPSSVPIGDAPYTVSGWLYPNQGTSFHGVVGWGNFETDYESNAFTAFLPGQFYNYWYNAGGLKDSDMLFDAPGITEGWNHFLCRSDQSLGLRQCFWNGALAASWVPSPKHNTKPAYFRIGLTHANEFFDGRLDDIAIFNRSLTDIEVVQAAASDYGPTGAGVCITADVSSSHHSSDAVMLSTDLNLGVGAVVEAAMSCKTTNITSGFVLGSAGYQTTNGTAFMWDCGTQTFQIGPYIASKFSPTVQIDRKPAFDASADIQLRMLVRTSILGDGLVEFYANDVMSHPYTISKPSTRLGSLSITPGIDRLSVKAWAMTLSSGSS